MEFFDKMLTKFGLTKNTETVLSPVTPIAPDGNETVLSPIAQQWNEKKVVGNKVATVQPEKRTDAEIIADRLKAIGENSRTNNEAGVFVRDEAKLAEPTVNTTESQVDIKLKEAKDRINNGIGSSSDVLLVNTVLRNKLSFKNS